MKWFVVGTVCAVAVFIALGTIEESNQSEGENSGEACYWNLEGEVKDPVSECLQLCAQRYQGEPEEKRACWDAIWQERALAKRVGS